MSGIAEVLVSLGYLVQGSDQKLSKITARLEKMGVRVFEGHAQENLGEASVVVVSTAIKADNLEFVEACARGLSIVRRAEMLAELMRLKSNIAVAGTHGKTTTTTLIAEFLVEGGIDPTIINGGIIHRLGSNARLGQGEWMVVEADESDGTFVRLPATVAVVTNIDPEHLDYWGDFEALRQGFLNFIRNVPFYGVAICCTDHPEVQALVGKIEDRQVVSYGFNMQAEIRAENLTFKDGASYFDIVLSRSSERIEGCVLPMPGAHNVSNALAAVGVCLHLGMSLAQIKKALAVFGGVARRFSVLGEVGGVKIIDDYAHHPVELAATLLAARQVTKGRVIAIHQPHRFSRLSDLFEEFCACFNEADFVAITEVFAAGESPIKNVGRDQLVAGLIAHGHKGASGIDGPAEMKKYVRALAKPGDVVLCLGAGSISAWANDLVCELAG